MKVTIRKIAELTNVSPATVSLVLNNKPGVSKEVRNRVAAALVENGYTIRNLQQNNGNRRNILFIYYRSTNWISSRKDDFLTRILDGVESGGRKNNCVITIVNATHDNIHEILAGAHNDGHDGIIFLGTEYAHFEQKLFEQAKVPLICIDRLLEHFMVNAVAIDNFTGIFQAITYLMELGHRNMGFLASDYLSGSVENREQCFYSTMYKLNLPIKQEWIVRLSFLKEEAIGEIYSYLKTQKTLPTAFLATNDVMAIAMTNVLRENGYSVPEDISVIGFDDSGISTMISPQLTTIHADLEKMGELAVSRLITMLSGATYDIQKITLASSLVIRKSTDYVKGYEPKNNHI